MKEIKRTSARLKAVELANILRIENPDYDYLREVFRHLRKELNIAVTYKEKATPYIPTEEEIKKFYETVWKSRKMKHVVLVKALLYTGIRVSELIHVKITDVDFDQCQIRVAGMKGKNNRKVLFPNSFAEILAMHAETIQRRKGEYLFESTWRKPYTERGVHKVLTRYRKAAGITNPLSPKQLRYFLINWFKDQGLEEGFIKSHAGTEEDQHIEKYKILSLQEVKEAYENTIGFFPI
jgi:integrase/recombinase XerD